MSTTGKAVFLSYASEDAESAKRIFEALREAGVEVWFDESELRGGDDWDANIRGQIRDCALFLPVVSAHTQARREGYFRLEWKLADERTHLMAEGTPFILPVVADGTKERDALVPKSFLHVQWAWLPHGEVPAAFVERVRKLVGAETDVARVSRPANLGNTGQETRATGINVPNLLSAAAPVTSGTGTKLEAYKVGELAAQPAAEPAADFARPARHRWLPVALALLAGAATTGLFWWLHARSAAVRQGTGTVRLAMPVVAGTPSAREIFGLSPQISPDGKTIVYGVIRNGTTRLMLRGLNQHEATAIAETEDASYPFFSPDSRWVGFFASSSRQLKKVPVSGGSPITICSLVGTEVIVGASWGRDDRIVFVPSYQSGLWSVPSSGGTPQLVLDTNVAKDRIVYGWPQALPGGKGVLFMIGTGRLRSMDEAQIAVLESGAKEPRIVIQGGGAARYLPTGHLVYGRAGSLLAVRFDLSRLEAAGTPIPVVEGVPTDPPGGAAGYSISDNGTLVYPPGGAIKGDANLVLIDRKGNIQAISQAPAFYGDLAASPDGRRAVVRIFAANDDLWTLDMAQGTPLRLTSEPGDESNPVWTPDGTRIAFGWRLGGMVKVFWKAADGTGEAEELSRGDYPRYPGSFSPDGRTLAFVETHPSKLRDIWTMPVSGDGKPQPFQATNADEWAPQFSRDGRWIAYVSNETGRNEIFVRPATTAGGRKQISTDGGTWPIWSHNGKEIFYLNDKRLMIAAVDPQSGSAGKAATVLELKFQPISGMFDVMADGERFLMSMPSEHPSPTHFNVILNWFEELQRLVPAR